MMSGMDGSLHSVGVAPSSSSSSTTAGPDVPTRSPLSQAEKQAYQARVQRLINYKPFVEKAWERLSKMKEFLEKISTPGTVLPLRIFLLYEASLESFAIREQDLQSGSEGMKKTAQSQNNVGPRNMTASLILLHQGSIPHAGITPSLLPPPMKKKKLEEPVDDISELLEDEIARLDQRLKDNSTKKLKEIISSLTEVMECPICLDTVKVPLRQCATGHVLCCDCTKDLVRCPTCQKRFTTENPVAVKNLLEALPRLCCYSDDGCEQVFKSADDHEVFCGYRPVRCREFGCTDTPPLCQLLKHYDKQHPKRLVIKKDVENLEWPNFNPEIKEYDKIPVFLFGNVFWVVQTNDIREKQLKFRFEVAPNGRPLDDYYVRLEFKQDIFFYSYTIKASVACSSNEDETSSGNRQEIYCMKVPQSELHRFVNKDKKLEYKLVFHKISK